jgi:hypothetical protein
MAADVATTVILSGVGSGGSRTFPDSVPLNHLHNRAEHETIAFNSPVRRHTETTMPLPTLTPEQRTAALEKAAAARKTRSDMLAGIKAGTLSLADVFARADGGDEIVRKTKVLALLKALPGWGPKTATATMERIDIAEDRRIGGLGARQRTALLDAAAH